MALPAVPTQHSTDVLVPNAAASSVFTKPVDAPDEAIDSELRVLLTHNKLPLEVLHAIVAEGFTTVELFAALASSEEAARSFFENDFQLDKSQRGWRAIVAKLIVAWAASRQRGQARASADAEAHLAGRPSALSRSKRLELRRAFEQAHDRALDESSCPAGPYVDLKLLELEEGELRPEPWARVATVAEEVEDTQGGLLQVTDGTLRISRPPRAVARLPQSTEELRSRIQVMATCYDMVLLRSPSHPMMAGLSKELWADYTTYLLGKEVLGWVVRDTNGTQIFAAPWSAVLAYEFAMRKEACDRVNRSGVGFGHALRAAMQLSTLYTHAFVLPLSATAVAGAASSRGSAAATTTTALQDDHQPVGRGSKRKRNDKGKGGKAPRVDGGGNSSGNGAGSAGASSDNPPTHVCTICGKPGHSAQSCWQRPKGSQPKGKGKGKGNSQDKRKAAGDKREPCRDWNKGKCKLTDASHLASRPHHCSRCGGNHPAIRCKHS